MNIVFLLHFYQPLNQQDDILERIVNESYRPLLDGLIARPTARINANISGVLTKLLVDKGYGDVIEKIRLLIQSGQLELTASAMYHPILPLLPESECIRQIELNEQINKQYIGELYNPKGFFPPEMAVNDMVFDICVQRGYTWIAAPTVSCTNISELSRKHFVYKDSSATLLFRNMAVSSIILSAQVKSGDELLSETKDFVQQDSYWFTVMDAETFGHHRIGHQNALFDILEHSKITSLFGTEVSKLGLEVIKEVHPLPGTWTNEEQDAFLSKEGKTFIPFVLWNDPQNPIHVCQWELTNLLLNSLVSYKNKESANFTRARELADFAIASDQYWWASGNPWWSLEMIEVGAFELKNSIETLFADDISEEATESLKKASNLYMSIIQNAFEWQRTGYIKKKHIEYSKTKLLPALKDRTSAEWFNQLVLEFEHEMNTAASAYNFEKAIKWRDAIYKISLGTDKYDILHMVDELWLGRNLPWATPVVKPFLEHTWGEFSDFAKLHFLNCATEEEFENWKRAKS